MKKLLLILLLLFSVNIFGISHGFIQGFSIKYNVIDIIMLEDNTVYNNKDSISISLTTGYRIENFRVKGVYQNTLTAVKIDNYTPNQDLFKIDLSYSFTDNISVHFVHWCSHPVVTQHDSSKDTINYGKRFISLNYYKEY